MECMTQNTKYPGEVLGTMTEFQVNVLNPTAVTMSFQKMALCLGP